MFLVFLSQFFIADATIDHMSIYETQSRMISELELEDDLGGCDDLCTDCTRTDTDGTLKYVSALDPEQFLSANDITLVLKIFVDMTPEQIGTNQTAIDFVKYCYDYFPDDKFLSNDVTAMLRVYVDLLTPNTREIPE
jgi:hypothetical protein